MAEELARRSAAAALGRVLEVLDGVLAIEPSGPKGELVLLHARGGESVRPNDPEFESLEEVLKELLAHDL